MNQVNEHYWYEMWHDDKDLHRNLCIKNITKLNRSNQEDSVSIYADTDSVDYQSVIKTDKGIYTIEEWYNKNINNGSGGNTLKGHESVLTDDKILNYHPSKGLYYAAVKRIIRHKVTKDKWKLRTKSGKEVIITNDHSMIVFRNGEQIEVKPIEVLKTDKILILKS